MVQWIKNYVSSVQVSKNQNLLKNKLRIHPTVEKVAMKDIWKPSEGRN